MPFTPNVIVASPRAFCAGMGKKAPAADRSRSPYADRLRSAAGAFFPMPAQNARGDATMTLGVKGIAYWEFSATGGAHGGPTRAEIHGSNKAIVDSPVWRLVQALASLVSADGNTI